MCQLFANKALKGIVNNMFYKIGTFITQRQQNNQYSYKKIKISVFSFVTKIIFITHPYNLISLGKKFRNAFIDVEANMWIY